MVAFIAGCVAPEVRIYSCLFLGLRAFLYVHVRWPPRAFSSRGFARFQSA